MPLLTSRDTVDPRDFGGDNYEEWVPAPTSLDS